MGATLRGGFDRLNHHSGSGVPRLTYGRSAYADCFAPLHALALEFADGTNMIGTKILGRVVADQRPSGELNLPY